MNNTRFLFAIATAIMAYLLLDKWQAAQLPVPVATPSTVITPGTTTPSMTSASAELPTAPPTLSAETPAATSAVTAPALAQPVAAKNYRVETDVFVLEFSPEGANIVEASLKPYSLSLQNKALVKLISTQANKDLGSIMLRTQSGLLSANASLPNHLASYSAPSSAMTMAADQNSLEVPFVWTDNAGLTVKKIYSFTRGSYLINVRDEVTNNSATPITANSYRQFIQMEPPGISASFFSSPEQFSFVGTAIYSPEKKFEKFAIDSYRESNLDRAIVGGWLASLKHHFFVGWIPTPTEPNQYQTSLLPADATQPERMLARQQSPVLTIAPNSTAKFAATLYVGPKLQSTLDRIAPGLSKTVDYGRVTIFSEPLYWLLNKLHSLVKNWGLAIILLVVIIKLLFYKLSEKQFRSSAKMKAIAPRMEEIKRRYPDDRQKQAQAQMELFAKEKVNPLAGCLPILLQIPVFFGLYWVLVESVELRQAPFLFWIKDLTAADPYFVLPVMNALVMFLTSKLTPMTGMDPIQQKMFTYMPLFFGVMMAFFPAGLVLYWTVNGLLTLAQQMYINRKIDAEMAVKKLA